MGCCVLANVHFSAVGTNYLQSQQPPSPLQNYWSLSVEEQFYVVYPTLFLFLAGIRTRFSLRARLTGGLLLVIAASLTFSVIDTASNATVAYFSPFTRAWELALGALVAVATPWLKAVPRAVAAMASWIGLGAVLYAAFAFDAKTAYPGSVVIVPVAGAALIIAGGVTAGTMGAEAALGFAPVRLLGKLSYSLYLWHWPILILAAEYAGRSSLSVPQNSAWDVVALIASVITYVAVENPIRHAKPLLRVRWASIGLGVALVAVSLGAITVEADAAGGSPIVAQEVTPKAASAQGLLALVAASSGTRTIPSNLVPPYAQLVTKPESEIGFPPVSSGCRPSASQSRVPACVFGDRSGSHTMVLYGDSHAGMWFVALDDIAKHDHWKLVVLFKPACLASPLATHALGSTGPWVACEQWQRFALNRVNRIDPELLIVSQASYYTSPTGVRYTPAQWQHGLALLVARVTAPKTETVVLGNIPSSGGPDCMARHRTDLPACATSPRSALTPYNDAEARAATGRARYVDVTPWFCSRSCSPVVGRYDVYLPGGHVAVGYSRFIEGVLARALGLPTSPGTRSVR